MENISDIAPRLSKIKNPVTVKGSEHPFAVPENYFRDLPLKVQEKIKTGSTIAAGARIYTLARRYAAIAAFIAGIALIIYSLVNYISGDRQPVKMTAGEIREALISNNYEIDEDMLIDAIDVQGSITGIKTDPDAIIDYLVDNKINDDALIDEY